MHRVTPIHVIAPHKDLVVVACVVSKQQRIEILYKRTKIVVHHPALRVPKEEIRRVRDVFPLSKSIHQVVERELAFSLEHNVAIFNALMRHESRVHAPPQDRKLGKPLLDGFCQKTSRVAVRARADRHTKEIRADPLESLQQGSHARCPLRERDGWKSSP